MKWLLLTALLTGCTAATVQPTPIPWTPSPVPVATPFHCIPLDFCYPRLKIDSYMVEQTEVAMGAITHYTQYTFGIVIAAHAYGGSGIEAITQWQAGDDVLVYGQHYTVFNAATVLACVPQQLPPSAKVYIMTSINAETCESGKHQNIIVMAN